MTLFVELAGPISVIGTAFAVAFFGNREYKKREKLEDRLSLAEADRDVSCHLYKATLEEFEKSQGSLHHAQDMVHDSLAKQEKLAAEISELTNLSAQYVIDKEASRKALEAEVKTRVEFQTQAHYLEGELESLRAEHNELRDKHLRFLNTRDQIVSDLGRAQVKLEEWQERWDAHQRMQSTTEQTWRRASEENRRLRDANDILRADVRDLACRVSDLTNGRPVRGKNGRFAKKTETVTVD